MACEITSFQILVNYSKSYGFFCIFFSFTCISITSIQQALPVITIMALGHVCMCGMYLWHLMCVRIYIYIYKFMISLFFFFFFDELYHQGLSRYCVNKFCSLVSWESQTDYFFDGNRNQGQELHF